VFVVHPYVVSLFLKLPLLKNNETKFDQTRLETFLGLDFEICTNEGVAIHLSFVWNSFVTMNLDFIYLACLSQRP